jgi:hypothetical protein
MKEYQIYVSKQISGYPNTSLVGGLPQNPLPCGAGQAPIRQIIILFYYTFTKEYHFLCIFFFFLKKIMIAIVLLRHKERGMMDLVRPNFQKVEIQGAGINV